MIIYLRVVHFCHCIVWVRTDSNTSACIDAVLRDCALTPAIIDISPRLLLLQTSIPLLRAGQDGGIGEQKGPAAEENSEYNTLFFNF